jgi:hypothetical protein
MSEIQGCGLSLSKALREAQGANRYEIRLGGHLGARWAAWFDGLSLTNQSDGTTLISGLVADQAALHGLLQKVRDLGVPLISVTQTDLPTSTKGETT